VTEQNKMVRLHGDGAITYGMRFTTTLACMMDLHYYPLDSQNCTVEIESYGYTVSDVVMYWREEPVVGVDKAELPQFTIVRWETNERKIRLATGKESKSRQTIHCCIHLLCVSFFLIRYIPTFIAFFQVATQYWLLCVSNISSINLNRDAFLGLILDQP